MSLRRRVKRQQAKEVAQLAMEATQNQQIAAALGDATLSAPELFAMIGQREAQILFLLRKVNELQQQLLFFQNLLTRQGGVAEEQRDVRDDEGRSDPSSTEGEANQG